MSWCDKLASTPTVGIFLEANFTPAAAILNSLSDKLTSYTLEDGDDFSVVTDDAFKLDIQLQRGFALHFEPTAANVTFRHRMKFRQTSAALPIAELISKPDPYTHLLGEAANLLFDVAVLLPGANKRKVTQVGVVSTTHVDLKDAPPGFVKFADYVSRPFPKGLQAFNTSLTVVTSEDGKGLDRCIQTFVRRQGDELCTIALDYQRHFNDPFYLRAGRLSQEFDSVRTSALRYMEDLAVGDMFDVDSARPEGQ